MKSVNKVTLLGHITNDPEFKTLPGGHDVCKFGLATNRVLKDAKGNKQEVPEYHNIVCWKSLAEFAGKYLKKGKPIFIEGYLKTGAWENPQGVRLYRTEVVVENIVLLGANAPTQE